MKPILTKEENVNLYLKNFMQLGEALMNAGGNSFLILKKYDDFLRTLAANNIEVTAKYNHPEEAVPLKTTGEDDPRMTEEDWNSFGEYHLSPENNEWLKQKKWREKKAKFDEDFAKIGIRRDPTGQKPLSVADPKPNTLEVYPSELIYGNNRPNYFLEIYNGEQWKLCLRAKHDFSVPKFGWSSGEVHPYTLGQGKIASEGLISMYSLHNLKKIVDGLNMQDTKESSPLPPPSFETSKEKIDWQKNYPYPITTSP
jgi:hypothetical protein